MSSSGPNSLLMTSLFIVLLLIAQDQKAITIDSLVSGSTCYRNLTNNITGITANS